MRFMLGSEAVGKPGKSRTNSRRLVDRYLLRDRQMHGKMQERVALAAFHGVISRQCLVHIRKCIGVFTMLNDPVKGDCFKWRQDFLRLILAEGFAEKTAHIML